jgi:hypothetical protein
MAVASISKSRSGRQMSHKTVIQGQPADRLAGQASFSLIELNIFSTAVVWQC